MYISWWLYRPAGHDLVNVPCMGCWGVCQEWLIIEFLAHWMYDCLLTFFEEHQQHPTEKTVGGLGFFVNWGSTSDSFLAQKNSLKRWIYRSSKMMFPSKETDENGRVPQNWPCRELKMIYPPWKLTAKGSEHRPLKKRKWIIFQPSIFRRENVSSLSVDDFLNGFWRCCSMIVSIVCLFSELVLMDKSCTSWYVMILYLHIYTNITWQTSH